MVVFLKSAFICLSPWLFWHFDSVSWCFFHPTYCIHLRGCHMLVFTIHMFYLSLAFYMDPLANLSLYCFQIINVYNQEYESGAAFWPSVHGRIITALIVSQLLFLGLLSTKGAGQSTPVLLVLPVVTFYFHKYCKNRFEPAFVEYPLQVILFPNMLVCITMHLICWSATCWHQTINWK